MSTKKTLNYSKDDLRRALDSIKNGTPCSAAAKQYNVPRTTLIGKIQGIYPEDCRSGAPSVLTVNEENLLIQWIINMGRMGFPVTKDQLLDSVSLLVKNLKRSNNFTDGRPGRRWFDLFTKRHPEISERIAQNLCASRAVVTENKIRNWHKEIEDYFISSGIIITDPKRIFNTDESAFFLSPKGRKILAKKGSKSLHDRSGDDKECLTVLVTGNAAGQLAPPMVMYAYERIPKHVVSQVPKGWAIGKSTSGWMTSESFFEFITNVFYPWLLSESIQFPVILYLDGHKSHVTLPLTEFCREKQIIVISLLPNSTHILQPLDVGLFKTLKMKWKSEVQNFKTQNNYKHLGKDTFAPVLQNALKSVTNLENIFKNSFRVCGLFPFNADNIDYHKLLTQDNNELDKTKETVNIEIESHLRYLESYVQPDFLKKCYELMGADWTGNIEDKSLYDIWYKIYQKSGLSQDKEKQPNITIEIQEGLILEDGWENLVQFEADDAVPADIFEIEPTLESIETTGDVIIGSKEEPDKENIPEKEKSIDEIVEEENGGNRETGVSGKSIEGILQNIEITPEKRTDNVEGEQSREESVNEAEIVDSRSNTEHSRVLPGVVIPSPFKNSLFWPEPTKKVSKRNSRIKVPSVGTSDAWREYFLKKENEQKKSIQEKEERKKKREENKKLRQEKIKKPREKSIRQNKGKNTSEEEKRSDSEEDLSQDHEETGNDRIANEGNGEAGPSIDEIKIGDFVIVNYFDDHYPAQITNKDTEKWLANAMAKAGGWWKWPNTKDEIWYDHHEIVKKIKPPVEITKRGFYAVEELKYHI